MVSISAYFGKRLYTVYVIMDTCSCVKHAHLYRSASQQLSMCRPRLLPSLTDNLPLPTLVVLIIVYIAVVSDKRNIRIWSVMYYQSTDRM